MATLYKYLTQGGREVTFLDEQDQYKSEDIRIHWGITFPELTNASVEIQTPPEDSPGLEVEVDGNKTIVQKIVTFAKRVGTKGSDSPGPRLLRLYLVSGQVNYLIEHRLTVNRVVLAGSPDEAAGAVLAGFEAEQRTIWEEEPEVDDLGERGAVFDRWLATGAHGRAGGRAT